MFIDNDKQFVYVAIPKTGTYSIHTLFGYVTGHPEPAQHHAGIREIIAEYPETRDYYHFGFVRNPWSKLVSVYNDFVLRRGHQYSQKIRMDKPLLSEFEDFNDFCINLGSSDWFKDIFFRPQFESVTYESGDEIDYIGKFESLNTDMNFVCFQLNISVQQLAHKNVGQYQDRDYRQHYSKEAQYAVEELYHEDIRRFNYEF